MYRSNMDASLPPLPLSPGVTHSYLDCTASCGLTFHILQAGQPGNPLVLFCHGFPELAFSWRDILPKVAEAGFFAVAMDQRGYGRTTGWKRCGFHEVDLNEYTFTNLVRDLVCLVYKLRYTQVYSIIGHDFGAVSSSMAALMRPDIFRSTVQMSHPHHAPPAPAFGEGDAADGKKPDIQDELAKLDPPRKHYKWYNSTPQAAHDWDHPAMGLERFLRGYFHLKSADWHKNTPHPLKEWSAAELQVMPEYYIMQKEHSMPETVAHNMRGEDFTKSDKWLSAEELQVYCSEWKRTGFQGALNWYRAATAWKPPLSRDLLLYAGRRIEVPCIFISGAKDWGNFQQPGAFESYEDPRCVKEGCFRGAHIIPGAGHWVQQEQPDAVVDAMLNFFKSL